MCTELACRQRDVTGVPGFAAVAAPWCVVGTRLSRLVAWAELMAGATTGPLVAGLSFMVTGWVYLECKINSAWQGIAGRPD
jgi:hypothetical protein